MITPTDIANIIYRDCSVFDITVMPEGETLTGELTGERIVIHSKQQQPGKYWKKSYVEVNFCVPDIRQGEADTIRLNELEHMAQDTLDGVVGNYGGKAYRYSVSSIGIESDDALSCHYVNVRLLFEVLNVI